MAEAVELTLRPKPDAKPLDAEVAARIAGVARAGSVQVHDGAAVFSFTGAGAQGATARGNLEMAARFELGAHWHTRYELVER